MASGELFVLLAEPLKLITTDSCGFCAMLRRGLRRDAVSAADRGRAPGLRAPSTQLGASWLACVRCSEAVLRSDRKVSASENVRAQ